MKRKKVLVMFIGMCMIFTLGMPVFIPSADATPVTIYAPDPTGIPETDSENIQNALDSMNPGDTLYLAEGRYKICRPLVTHSFHGNIIGAGMDETFIEAVEGPLGYFEVAHMYEYDGPETEEYYTTFFYFGSPETSIAVSGFTLEVNEPGIAESSYTFNTADLTYTDYGIGNEIFNAIDISLFTDCDTLFENIRISGVYPDALSPRFGIAHWWSSGGTHVVRNCVFQNAAGRFACGPYGLTDAKYVFESNVVDVSFRGFQTTLGERLDIRVLNNEIHHTDYPAIANFYLQDSNMKVSHNNLVDVDGGFWYYAETWMTAGSRYLVEHNYIELRQYCWTGGVETWDFADAKSDLVATNNWIHSVDATAPYGPICLNGMQDAIIAFNKITGNGPAAMYIGLWIPCDGIVLLSNNVRNFDVTDGNWEPPMTGDPLEGVGRIWLGSLSSNCLIVGGCNKKDVVNEGTNNIVVGVDKIGWLKLGRLVANAVHRILHMRMLFH